VVRGQPVGVGVDVSVGGVIVMESAVEEATSGPGETTIDALMAAANG